MHKEYKGFYASFVDDMIYHCNNALNKYSTVIYLFTKERMRVTDESIKDIIFQLTSIEAIYTNIVEYNEFLYIVNINSGVHRLYTEKFKDSSKSLVCLDNSKILSDNIFYTTIENIHPDNNILAIYDKNFRAIAYGNVMFGHKYYFVLKC